MKIQTGRAKEKTLGVKSFSGGDRKVDSAS